MCQGYQGPAKAPRVQVQGPKAQQPQAQSTCLHCSLQAWNRAHACIVMGLWLWWPKAKAKAQAKAQTKAQTAAVAVAHAIALAQAFVQAPKSAKPLWRTQSRGLCLLMWG